MNDKWIEINLSPKCHNFEFRNKSIFHSETIPKIITLPNHKH